MRLNNRLIDGLNNTEQWWLKIRAVDYFDNIGIWSESITNFLPGHAPPDTILSFYDETFYFKVLQIKIKI